MFFRKEIIEGRINETGSGVSLGGSSKYSFIKVDGKMHRNVITEDFLDSFIQPGRTVRLGIRKTLTGKRLVASVQDGSGDTHKLPMSDIFAETIYLGTCWSFIVFLAALPLTFLFVYDLHDLGGTLKTSLFCAVAFLVYYFLAIQTPRNILEKVKPSAAFLQQHPDFK